MNVELEMTLASQLTESTSERLDNIYGTTVLYEYDSAFSPRAIAVYEFVLLSMVVVVVLLLLLLVKN